MGSLLSTSSYRAPAHGAPPSTLESLRALSNADLLKAFASDSASGRSPSATSFGAGEHNIFFRAEFLRRGAAIVPELCAALKKEIALHRPETSGQPAIGLVVILTRIGDPRAVEPLLEVAELLITSKNSPFSNTVVSPIRAVERLTFVCFHKVKPHWDNFSNSVQHQKALDQDHFSNSDMPKVIRLYRDWLEGEGKNPTNWLPLAQTRARMYLESDDLADVYCAASFLTEAFFPDTAPPSRDDMPERTLQRLAQILGGLTRDPDRKEHEYLYQGKPLPVSIYNWIYFVTAYGPRARPLASDLIRFQNETGLDNWSGLQAMGKVGGSEIMAFYVDALSAINKEVDQIRKDPDLPKGFSSDDRRGWWLQSQRICREAINRWAGQSFESDNARFTWWHGNKDKSPEQWLRDSAPVTIERADKSQRDDVRLFRILFPDAPYGTDEQVSIALNIYDRGATPLPYRNMWFEQHRDELIYDPNVGAFRLPNAPTRQQPGSTLER